MLIYSSIFYFFLPELFLPLLADLAAALESLYADDEFVETVNDWRQNLTVDSAEFEALYNDLEQFCSNAGVDMSVVNDVADFISDFYSRIASEGEAEITGEDSGILMTNMMDIALRMGNPALAIIFYITGSNTIINGIGEDDSASESADAVSDDVTATTSEVTADAVGEDGELIDINILGEDGEVITLADEEAGGDLTTKNVGLGEVVMGFQDEVLTEMGDLYDDIDDWTDEIGGLDVSDPEDQTRLEELRTRIQTAQSMVRTQSELIEMSQEILEALLQTASALSDSQFNTMRQIANRI